MAKGNKAKADNQAPKKADDKPVLSNPAKATGKAPAKAKKTTLPSGTVRIDN